MGVKVDVGVSVDNEGALTAYVKRVVQEDTPGITVPLIQQGFQHYDRQVLPDSIARFQRDPRRRG